MRRGEKSGSSGKSGLKGILKNECNVCPPTLTAAIPVGASTTCSFLVWAQIYLRKVLFPVPAFPVRNTERCVFCIIFHAFWNSMLSRSIFSMLTPATVVVGCQLSVVSCRLSVISCELSKVVVFPEMAKKQREHLLTKAPSHDNICCIPFFRSGNQWLAQLYCYCP